jgi:hypothetical protein
VDTAWSRWLVGAWAVLAITWLLVATVMLVQTWPDARSGGDSAVLFGNPTHEFVFDRAMKGQATVRAAPAVREHIKQFLLFTIVPPAFLLVLVCVALRIAGLPFPSFRSAQQAKLP